MRFAAFLGAMLLLAACTGTGAGVPVPAAPDAQPLAPAGATATLRLRIPTRRADRTTRYVSPSTRSIAITIAHAGKSQRETFNLTPATNPNCTPSPIVCNLALKLAIGANTLSFATFDGLLDGSGNPTGHELSANQSFPLRSNAARKTSLKRFSTAFPSRLRSCRDRDRR